MYFGDREQPTAPTNDQTPPKVIVIPAPKDPHPYFVDVPKNIVEMIMSRNVFISTEHGSGSGGRIGNGLILTDYHVVCDLETRIERTSITVDRKRAEIVAKDHDNDLAILRLWESDNATPLDLHYDSELIKLNTPVVIVGNPNLGLFFLH